MAALIERQVSDDSGQICGCHSKSPEDPSSGLRFDSRKVLLAIYARGVLTGTITVLRRAYQETISPLA